MKQVIEKQITGHSKCIDILNACFRTVELIEIHKLKSPVVYVNRLRRQLEILISEYNSEIKKMMELVVVSGDPLKLDDMLVSEKVKKWFSVRTINGLIDYVSWNGGVPDQCTMEFVLNIKPEQFMNTRNVGAACVRELMDFQIKMARQ